MTFRDEAREVVRRLVRDAYEDVIETDLVEPALDRLEQENLVTAQREAVPWMKATHRAEAKLAKIEALLDAREPVSPYIRVDKVRAILDGQS